MFPKFRTCINSGTLPFVQLICKRLVYHFQEWPHLGNLSPSSRTTSSHRQRRSRANPSKPLPPAARKSGELRCASTCFMRAVNLLVGGLLLRVLLLPPLVLALVLVVVLLVLLLMVPAGAAASAHCWWVVCCWCW